MLLIAVLAAGERVFGLQVCNNAGTTTTGPSYQRTIP